MWDRSDGYPTKEQQKEYSNLRKAWTKYYKSMGLSDKKIRVKIGMRINKGKMPEITFKD